MRFRVTPSPNDGLSRAGVPREIEVPAELTDPGFAHLMIGSAVRAALTGHDGRTVPVGSRVTLERIA